MSVQAMTWALAQQLVSDPTARHVLLCLANYASERGEAAFPSVSTLTSDTGLSERCVRQKLADLVEAGAIRLGNPEIAKAYIGRRGYQPTVYDLAMTRGARGAPLKAESEPKPGRGASGAALDAGTQPDEAQQGEGAEVGAGAARGANGAPLATGAATRFGTGASGAPQADGADAPRGTRGAAPAPLSETRGAAGAGLAQGGVHVVPNEGCTTCTQSVSKEIQGGAGAHVGVPAHAHTRVREAELGELSQSDRQMIASYLDGLPASIEIPLWVDFVKHRKVRRAGLMSISSYRQLLRDLQQLEADGVDLNDSLRETLSLDLIKPVDPRTSSRRQGARPNANRPRVSDDFNGVQYASTDVSDLPEDLQPETTHAD